MLTLMCAISDSPDDSPKAKEREVGPGSGHAERFVPHQVRFARVQVVHSPLVFFFSPR
jgi:hypothetical protein